MDLNVRKAIPADSQELALLMNAAGEGIPAYLWAELAEEGEDPMACGTRRVARPEGAFSYTNAHVAVVEGAVAGMLLGYRLADTIDPVPPDSVPALVRPMLALEARAPGTWYVNGVATAAPFRGRGIGTRLMMLAETLAHETGADGLSLIVAEGNHTASTLYTKLGYECTAREPIVPYPGCPHTGDWLLMQKPLATGRGRA